MNFKNFKNYLIFLRLIIMLAFFLVITPYSFATEIEHFQKLKNVTRQDPSVGSVLTIAGENDEIHYLIFLKNLSASNQTFYLQDVLANNSIYQTNSAKFYLPQSGFWRDVPNNTSFPFKSYKAEIPANEWIYFKFHTNIKKGLPQINILESNVVEIFDQKDNVLTKSITKIAIPNAPLILLKNKTEQLSESEKQQAQEILDEELSAIKKIASFSEQNSKKIIDWEKIYFGIIILIIGMGVIAFFKFRKK